MGLETGNFISDLVESNPLGTDDKSQGDDHIRLIKHVLKTQFPSLDGAMTSTDEELNAIQDTTLFVPSGIIVMWSGAIGDIPDGWNVCDGTNGTPNLVGRFIVGSDTDVGGTFDIGDTGGVDSNTHAHSGSVANHTLTIQEMPSHNHGMGITISTAGDGNPATGGAGSSATISTGFSGGNQGHNHGLTIDDAVLDNKPPYYALAYIQKS